MSSSARSEIPKYETELPCFRGTFNLDSILFHITSVASGLLSAFSIIIYFCSLDTIARVVRFPLPTTSQPLVLGVDEAAYLLGNIGTPYVLDVGALIFKPGPLQDDSQMLERRLRVFPTVHHRCGSFVLIIDCVGWSETPDENVGREYG